MNDEAFDLSLGYFRGSLDSVLTAIQHAGLEDAVLELEGAPSEELFDFAEELTADDPDLRRRNHHARHGGWRLGPIHFGGGPLYVPVSDENVARLREIADRHAAVEIAFELRVLAGDETLLCAPDVGDNEIWVSRRLSGRAVAAIRTALGSGLDQRDADV